MTRNRRIYRDVQIGNLTNRIKELEEELLEKEMTAYDMAERYGTASHQYEIYAHVTLAIRADIEEYKAQLDEHLQATY